MTTAAANGSIDDAGDQEETIARLRTALRTARPYVLRSVYPVGHPDHDWRSEIAEDVLAIVDAELPARIGGV